MTTIKQIFAALMLLASPSIAAAAPESTKSGTLEKGCQALGKAKLCIRPEDATGRHATSLFVAGRRTNLLSYSLADHPRYELEERKGVYRARIGSDKPFSTYGEVAFRKAGSRYQVVSYTRAIQFECYLRRDGGPIVRVIYDFDLARGTLTAALSPPGNNDRRINPFVRKSHAETTDLFRQSEFHFSRLLEQVNAATGQQHCSA